MTKPKHDYKCDTCGKPAEYAIENTYQKYLILPDGDYQLEDEWEGSFPSEYFCEECL